MEPWRAEEDVDHEGVEAQNGVVEVLYAMWSQNCITYMRRRILLWFRIRINIKVKGRIRIRIKVKGRIRIRVKVKGRIRIRDS
jgi:hypothetical protein